MWGVSRASMEYRCPARATIGVVWDWPLHPVLDTHDRVPTRWPEDMLMSYCAFRNLAEMLHPIADRTPVETYR